MSILNHKVSSLIMHNVHNSTRRTSIRLEPEFWQALHTIAIVKNVTVDDLIKQAEFAKVGSLTSAVRVLILNHFMLVTNAD